MHTGLDFRSSTGDPVRATANGTVESAGWSGGYGKMVEVDHGNGFATRYGHMSEIEVKVGQQIKIGQIIGRVGSTGRSTGRICITRPRRRRRRRSAEISARRVTLGNAL
jgi:murein DD-endopeptidase MepM/ murein hydrolase activator NlpD